MKEKAWYPIAYMFVLTALSSSILIGFSLVTRKRVEANEEFRFERGVLMAFGPKLDLSPAASSSQLHALYVRTIREVKVPIGKDETYTYYKCEKDGKLLGYGVPIRGQGFWAQIGGIVGVAPDRRTIVAVAFYEQKETPGLGAEIVKKDFRRQFEGKKIAYKSIESVKPSGKPDLFALKPPGSELTDNEVHAITGATQTSVRLQRIINEGLSTWLAMLAKEEAGHGSTQE